MIPLPDWMSSHYIASTGHAHHRVLGLKRGQPFGDELLSIKQMGPVTTNRPLDSIVQVEHCEHADQFALAHSRKALSAHTCGDGDYVQRIENHPRETAVVPIAIDNDVV